MPPCGISLVNAKWADPRTTVLQPNRRAHRLRYVIGPDRGSQPVLGIVRPGDHRLFVGERRHGHDRAEHLPPYDFVLVRHARDDRRLEEEARA